MPSRRARVLIPLVAMLVLLAGFAATFLLARTSTRGTWIDQTTLTALAPLREPWLLERVASVVRLGDPLPYLGFCVALAAIAWARRRRLLAVAVPVVLVGVQLSAQGMKVAFAQPRPQIATGYISDASWPSGHSTAAMIVALVAVLVVGRRLRPAIAAVGVLLALGVGVGLLVGVNHYPTDVIGGYLWAGVWWCGLVAVLAAVGERDRREARPRLRDLAAPAALALGVAAVLVVLAAGRPAGVLGLLRDDAFAVATIGGIVGLACALGALAVLLALVGDGDRVVLRRGDGGPGAAA